MDVIWSEEAIRAELGRLDAKTGLHGASLPISFGNAMTVLGMYFSREGGAFRFSNRYFQNPDWPRELALDVIRHEYAHYMDDKLYGGAGHGTTWKMCCARVGAAPVRLYNRTWETYYHQKHETQRALSDRLGGYAPGDVIVHPQCGEGVIESLTGEGASRFAVVSFPGAGKKTLSLAWVDAHCRVAERAAPKRPDESARKKESAAQRRAPLPN